MRHASMNLLFFLINNTASGNIFSLVLLETKHTPTHTVNNLESITFNQVQRKNLTHKNKQTKKQTMTDLLKSVAHFLGWALIVG